MTKTCPRCGTKYPEDLPKCPCCGYEEGQNNNGGTEEMAEDAINKDDERVVTEQEETMSEGFERAWEANIKRLISNELTQDKNVDSLSNLALLDAVQMQTKLNNAYATHVTNMNTQVAENNRKTLDFLYAVDPVEGAGLRLIIEAIREYQKQESQG